VGEGAKALMAYRQHPAADIVPGSIWSRRTGEGRATIIRTAAGYVMFELANGERGQAFHAHFRIDYVAPYDSREVRSQFSVCTANLSHFHAYWSAAARRLFARSANRPIDDARSPARGSPAVPPEAVHVGTYSDPFTTDAFLADLNDTLASLASPAA
jgi:hypothetical protein